MGAHGRQAPRDVHKVRPPVAVIAIPSFHCFPVSFAVTVSTLRLEVRARQSLVQRVAIYVLVREPVAGSCNHAVGGLASKRTVNAISAYSWMPFALHPSLWNLPGQTSQRAECAQDQHHRRTRAAIRTSLPPSTVPAAPRSQGLCSSEPGGFWDRYMPFLDSSDEFVTKKG
ncbi:hypothetical protein LZ30DRAFT_735338 [Colletotrichum cereale]|nr:hypothetical protein LZ30DRAFT_735338 [Colletotrichum cereale]